MYRRNAWFAIFLCTVLMSLCFCACTRRKEAAAPAQAGETRLPSSAAETLQPDGPVPAALEPGPASDGTEGAGPAPSFRPQEGNDSFSAGAVLAARERADDSLFDDAAFFGNSLMEGLGGFGGLQSGAFFAHAKIALYNLDTEKSAVLDDGGEASLYEAMTQRQYGKIYVLLGVNEIGWDASFFADRYEAFLERLRRDEPEAEIYIMSLTPVTRETSDSHEYFNMERVQAYNEALLALAEKTGSWYLDLCQALAGEDGYLPPERSAGDGIHFTEDTYPLWADYLRTHYAGVPADDGAAE